MYKEPPNPPFTLEEQLAFVDYLDVKVKERSEEELLCHYFNLACSMPKMRNAFRAYQSEQQTARAERN